MKPISSPAHAPYKRARLLAMFLALTWSVGAVAAERDQLTLRDGATLPAPGVLFRDTQFHDGTLTTPVPRQAVQDWWLQPATSDNSPAAAPVADSASGDLAEMQAWLAQAQTAAAAHPGCKGVQVVDWAVQRLTADHQERYHYQFVGLILDDQLLEWGNINLGFTEGRSRISGLRGSCLTPDGKLLQLDPASALVSRPGNSGDVFFDPNARQLNAALPGVAVGCLVALAFDYETYAPEDWRLFDSSFYFQSDVPVLLSRLDVFLPAGETAHWWSTPPDARPFWKRWFSATPGPQATRIPDPENPKAPRGWRWELCNQPPIVAEPAMPDQSEVVPAVQVTLMKNWDYLDTLIGGMQEERMKPTPELEALARELTAGAQNDDEKAARLYHWVQKKIRYISIKSSLSSGWTGHPAEETRKNGYGDCTDKSILLATLLRLSGIDAEPVVLRTNDAGLFTPTYPLLRCNHAITVAHVNGVTRYLDSTAQDYRYPAFRSDDFGAFGINFVRREHQIIPVPSPAEAAAKHAAETMTVSADRSLAVSLNNTYGGSWEAGLRGGWKGVPNELRNGIMQQSVSRSAPGAVLDSLTVGEPQDLTTPFTLQYAWHAPAYVQAAGEMRIFNLPGREKSFPEFGLDRRRYPIARSAPGLESRVITLQVPPGWRCIGPLPDVDLGNAHMRYREQWRHRGNQVEVTLEWQEIGIRIPASDYAACRELARKIEETTRKPLIFQVEKP